MQNIAVYFRHCRCHTKQAELLTSTTLSPSHTSQCLQTTLQLSYQPGHQQPILLQSQSPFLTTTAYYELQQHDCWDCPKKPYKAPTSSVPLQQSVDDRESSAKQPQRSQSTLSAASGTEVRLVGLSVEIRSCLHADREIHRAKTCSS